MHRINYIVLFCLLISGFHVVAQVAGIKRSYAFISLHQPGNIMVRPDGLPVHAGPDTLLAVYLEMPLTTHAVRPRMEKCPI